MNRNNRILLAVLAIQIVLVAITWFVVGSRQPVDRTDTPILAFTESDITRIRITGTSGTEETTPVVLTKEGTDWKLDSAGGYPCQNDKVEALIKLLIDMKAGDPIASNPANHAALNVAEQAFDRKVEITAGKDTVVLFVGRGGRSSGHVRFNGKDDVLEVRNLQVWSISSTPSGFIDTQFVTVTPSDISRVSVTNSHGTLSFSRAETGWQMPDVPADKIVDSQAIEDMLNRLASISMTVPEGRELKPEYGLDSAVKVTLEGASADTPFTISYTVGAKVDNTYYMKRDDNDFVVSVSTYSVEPAVEKKAENFLKDPPEEGDPGTMPEAGEGGIDPAILEQLGAMSPQMMGMP